VRLLRATRSRRPAEHRQLSAVRRPAERRQTSS
jgi:hypothetical protein